MWGRGLAQGLGITLKHALERDITIQYPEEKPFLEERYRGSLAYIYERCIACGLCVKACPNRVLILETYVPEGTKKKQVLLYSIDRQYCLFCNLCVEICPTATLYFSHDFELTQFKREDIKVVYHRPPPASPAVVPPPAPAPLPGTQPEPEGEAVAAAPELPRDQEAAAKRARQVAAMQGALGKSPAKILARIAAGDEEVGLLASLLASDERMTTKLAEMMVDDPDKARKFAAALVAKARKTQLNQGGEPDEPR